MATGPKTTKKDVRPRWSTSLPRRSRTRPRWSMRLPWQAPDEHGVPFGSTYTLTTLALPACIREGRQPVSSLLVDCLPNRVLHAADGILNLALGLLSLSFRFRLLVAQKLASCFLDATRKLLERPFDTIFVHHQAFSRYVICR